MKLTFSARSWEEHLYWQAEDTVVLRRLNTLIAQCIRTPFQGIGKPEPLKGDFAGLWSRQLTLEGRLVYRVFSSREDQVFEIVQCRFHY